MSEWHDLIPSDLHAKVSSDPQDVDDFFEEFIGKLLTKLGCRIQEHPPVGNGFADFLTTTPDGGSFYVDATVVRPHQFSEMRPTEVDACQKINGMCQDSYNYWFRAEANGELYQNLSVGHLRPIQEWVETLGANGIKPENELFTFHSGRPSTEWTIKMYATPRAENMRGIPALLLAGFDPREGGRVDSVSPLIQKARDKVRQHKNIAAPLVIAMNDVADFPSARIDISMALFGWEQVSAVGVSRITPPSEGMQRPSIWGRGENTTISAILLFHRLLPDTISYTEVCLYENPVARYPSPSWLRDSFPHAGIEGTGDIKFLRWPSEQRLSTVLGISSKSRPYADKGGRTYE